MIGKAIIVRFAHRLTLAPTSQFVGIIAVNAACIRPLFSSAHWLRSTKGSSGNNQKYTGSGDKYGHQLVTIGGGGQSVDRSGLPSKRRYNKYNMTELDNNSSEEQIVKSTESTQWPQNGGRGGSLTSKSSGQHGGIIVTTTYEVKPENKV